MKIKIYLGKTSWCVQISGRNNRILLDAAGYNTKRNALDSLKAILKYATAGDFTIVQGKNETAIKWTP